jgi:hypothetical protein
MEELLVSSLAQTDALAKLLIEKGLITREEFMQKISEERATYQKLLISDAAMKGRLTSLRHEPPRLFELLILRSQAFNLFLHFHVVSRGDLSRQFV